MRDERSEDGGGAGMRMEEEMEMKEDIGWS